MANSSRQHLKLSGDTHPPEVEWDPELDATPAALGVPVSILHRSQAHDFSATAAKRISAPSRSPDGGDRISLRGTLGLLAFAYLCFKLARL